MVQNEASSGPAYLQALMPVPEDRVDTTAEEGLGGNSEEASDSQTVEESKSQEPDPFQKASKRSKTTSKAPQ